MGYATINNLLVYKLNRKTAQSPKHLIKMKKLLLSILILGFGITLYAQEVRKIKKVILTDEK